MKTKQTGLGTMVILLFLSSLFLFSCGKKEIKSEEVAVKQPPPVEDEAEKAKQRARLREQQELAEKEMRERALKEQEAQRLREEEARKREEEARRQKDAAAKAQIESEDILFDYDQYLLSKEAKELLSQKAQWFKAYPSAKAVIEGHCDERGSAEYNLALGQKRADAAMQYLVSLGIEVGRISTISYGKEKPLDPGHTEAAWRKNRRAHFVIK